MEGSPLWILNGVPRQQWIILHINPQARSTRDNVLPLTARPGSAVRNTFFIMEQSIPQVRASYITPWYLHSLKESKILKGPQRHLWIPEGQWGHPLSTPKEGELTNFSCSIPEFCPLRPCPQREFYSQNQCHFRLKIVPRRKTVQPSNWTLHLLRIKMVMQRLPILQFG